MAYPCPVKTYHKDTYPTIDPTLEHLSTRGKNIVITGGGSGIGPALADAFGKSGAASISIIGRNESKLQAKKADLEKRFPSTKAYSYVADLVDKDAVANAFKEIKSAVGVVDVLIANAGYSPDLLSLEDSDFEDWYAGVDINVKGNFNLVKAFLTLASKTASVIHINAAISHLPYVPGYSGYHASKLASAKIFDYLHYERPEFFVLNIHPGVFDTPMSQKNPNARDFDTLELPADFVNWAVSPEASFLNGKFVWAHWDVDELKAMSKEIEGTNKFTLGLLGWP